MNYGKVKHDEYKDLASIHKKAFPNFFLTTLGDNFLKDYYKASLASINSISIGAVDDNGSIVGFAVGSLKSKGYHKNLLFENFYLFTTRAIILILTKPLAIIRLIKNLDKNKASEDDGNYSELLSIGISPELKGLGIGKELLFSFEKEVKKRGGEKVALTTDLENNERVISFYEKCGYKRFYSFTTFPSRKMYKMIKSLD